MFKARGLGLAGDGAPRDRWASAYTAHTAILRLSEVPPIMIEIIDIKEKSNLSFPHLDEMVLDRLVTL